MSELKTESESTTCVACGEVWGSFNESGVVDHMAATGHSVYDLRQTFIKRTDYIEEVKKHSARQ